MKKIFGIFMALFFMSSVSFANATAFFSQKCIDYAILAMDAEEAAYGELNDADWGDGAMWYYNACEAAGGNIGDPVFL